MNKREIFKEEGDKIVSLRTSCPKCGPGVFLAEHKDRFSCGKCGYTEFKSTSNKNKAKEEVSREVKEETKENG